MWVRIPPAPQFNVAIPENAPGPRSVGSGFAFLAERLALPGAGSRGSGLRIGCEAARWRRGQNRVRVAERHRSGIRRWIRFLNLRVIPAWRAGSADAMCESGVSRGDARACRWCGAVGSVPRKLAFR